MWWIKIYTLTHDETEINQLDSFVARYWEYTSNTNRWKDSDSSAKSYYANISKKLIKTTPHSNHLYERM